MNNLDIKIVSNSQIQINGELTEKNWNYAFDIIYDQIELINQPILCFENLTRADSSALSLIMQLSKKAELINKKLKIQKLPPFLAQLAKLYNLQV